MNLDNLFINLMHYLARTRMAKSNIYKVFVDEEYLVGALLSSNLITTEYFIDNKQYVRETVIPELQSKWLEIKDNL